MELINYVWSILPETHRKSRFHIFTSATSFESRKDTVMRDIENSLNNANWVKDFNGHCSRSFITHIIYLDEAQINNKYATKEDRTLHIIELLLHEFHHTFQVTYEGAIDADVSEQSDPLEVAADNFSKEQMILNKKSMSEYTGIHEDKIVQFANSIRRNKGAID